MQNAVSGRAPTSPRLGTDGLYAVIDMVLAFSRPGIVMENAVSGRFWDLTGLAQ